MDLELLKKICQQYELGTLECQPLPLKGGFLHKMYSLFTTTGKYAVKLLNPYIMQRKTAMENYCTAEKLELVLEQNAIPILPALIFQGRKMQKLDGRFFYLYEWYDGKALKSGEIKEIHCEKIGKLLAQIHKLDRRQEYYNRDELHVDWDFYIEQSADKNREIQKLLLENRLMLYEMQENGNRAGKSIPAVVSICHNDMDCKNVLWVENECRIIDLECLAYSSPFIELYEMALCWSGYETGKMDYHLFERFLHSYAEAGGELPADWECIYDSNFGRLEWLEYNVKRALGMECSVEEIEVGISEAKNTMKLLIYYYESKEDILRCLKKLQR